MKITDIREDSSVQFKDLSVKDFFVYESEYFVKIKTYLKYSSTTLNALSFNDFELYPFDDSTFVIPVSAELVISNSVVQ